MFFSPYSFPARFRFLTCAGGSEGFVGPWSQHVWGNDRVVDDQEVSCSYCWWWQPEIRDSAIAVGSSSNCNCIPGGAGVLPSVQLVGSSPTSHQMLVLPQSLFLSLLTCDITGCHFGKGWAIRYAGLLVGGFKYFLFSLLFGEDSHFD